MAPVLLLLLLGLLLTATSSLPPPRTSFLLDSADRPLVHFSLPDVHNTTTLLLSGDASTLYVGARDTVLSLDVSQSDVIRLKKKVQWSPSEDEIKSCEQKGKNPEVDCPNSVHVLQPINSTHLYACGSYAYNPHDAYIDAESLSMVHRDGAKGRCPYSPFERSAANAIDGELFTATTSDFRGVKPQISRHFSKDGRQDVNLESPDSKLEEPTFVSSSSDPADGKLYFFFSEIGKEFNFVERLQIARVAQVCKDDVGGLRTLQRKWTSFAKASLLCQSPKQLPFNVLQDVFTLPPPEGGDASDTLFYGVFTSQWSTGPESAVCIFKLQDIRTAFAGSYRAYDMQTQQWSQQQERHSYLGKCGLDASSDPELMEVRRSFLTSGSVKPVGERPIVVSSEQLYGRVAVMRTQAADGKQHAVLFLLTESGFLHKVALLDQGPRVIEEIQVFNQPQLIKNLVLSSSKGLLYVGTSEGVTAVPVARCSIYKSCSQCVLARDPLCGWSRTKRVCSAVGVAGSHDNLVQHLEDGGVGGACQGEPAVSRITEFVRVNDVVRLRCRKPSNMAALTWTSPRFRTLQEDLFIQSADGSLSFLATADTFGTYHCEAEEGGYKEVVASYDVRQAATPRSIDPLPKAEVYENIVTERPMISVIRPLGDPDNYEARGGRDEVTTIFKDESDRSGEVGGLDNSVDLSLTPRKDPQSSLEPRDDVRPEKSYYGEMVAVSLLLATCVVVLVLGSLHVWRQRKPGLKLDPLVSPEDGSKTTRSMEICSLSSPEDATPELKVME